MLTNFFQMLHQVNVGLSFSNLKKVWTSQIYIISQKFALVLHCQRQGQPDGHNYPSKRKKATNVQSKPSSLTEINEALQQATTIDKIDLVDSEDNDQENIDVSESENCSNVESASSSNESALILIEIESCLLFLFTYSIICL